MRESRVESVAIIGNIGTRDGCRDFCSRIRMVEMNRLVFMVNVNDIS